MILLPLALVLAVQAGDPPVSEDVAVPTEEAALSSEDRAREGIRKGKDFLLATQNADGSWGGVKNATFTSGFANPATYHCWQVGTTALVVQSLMQTAGEEAYPAVDDGLVYLQQNASLVRPAEWDVDNNWGLIYGLTALSAALQEPRLQQSRRYADVQKAATEMVDGLRRYQSPRGGWGYYADPGAGWRPEWATSFTTAAALLALIDAKKAGVEVDDKMYQAAIRAVERSHLPNGAYSYDVPAGFPRHMRMESINQVKGSLGRIQIGNLSLRESGGKLKEGELEWGVEQFFKHHKFLEVARNKPIPHEAYYANAAYFYLFGHYYVSRVITHVTDERRPEWEEELREKVLQCQQADGSAWDFWIAGNSKPYGTAFSIMTLDNSLSPQE